MFFIKEAMASGFGGSPMQATDVAVLWDHLYHFLIWLSIFFFILVVGGMIYFAIKYRHQKGLKTKYIVDHHGLEIFWTVIPTILLLVIFGWGWVVYKDMVHAPADAMEIRVIAKQWAWAYQYEDGRVTTNDVYVPVNKPVKFVMSSEDVLHSFFVPNFRVKSDVVPGMYTSVWFEAKIPGAHQIYCTEYCGASHSLMLGQVFVLEPEKWEMWKRGKKVQVTGVVAQNENGTIQDTAASAQSSTKLATLSLPEQGKKVMEAKGCAACHTSDGTKGLAPSHKGLFGSEVALADGSKVKADEDYIRESILKPNAKLVKGFAPQMPTYQGLLTEQDLNAVVAYIKNLK